MANDPVEAVITAYLDHLEHGAPAPSLDHLDDGDRQRALELIDLMREGRGIDVYRSRPSLDALLAGTEFEGWLDVPNTVGLTVDSIRADVISSLGSTSSPIADGTAENEGIRSNALVRFGTCVVCGTPTDRTWCCTACYRADEGDERDDGEDAHELIEYGE